MNSASIDRIAKAVLYEGYMLYPYGPSAVKNQHRFNFGVIYPQSFSDAQKGHDPWILRTECLVQGNSEAKLDVRVRFLQLVERSVQSTIQPGPQHTSAAPEFRGVSCLAVDGRTFYSWQEAIEHELAMPATDLGSLIDRATVRPIQLSATSGEEDLCDSLGVLRGRIVRTQNHIDGFIEVRAQQVSDDVVKIAVTVRNTTGIHDAAQVSREYALTCSLVSAHVVLGVEGGEFVSLLDPPESLRSTAETCRNEGVFPVLVGEEGQCDTILASPIILYDYPQIAPESNGDLFDGTEIDEILSLRIMTMTEEEKSEMRQSDERARQMLERTENMPAEQFMKLHGALRGLRSLNHEESR